MKNRNYKKTLAIVIASAAVATAVAGVPVVSKVQAAKADSETTSETKTTDSSEKNSGNSGSSSYKGKPSDNDDHKPPQNGDGQTPPEKPEGKTDGNEGNDQNGKGNTPPGKPGDDNNGNGGPGGQSANVTYSSATTFKKSATTNKKTYSSKKSGQNAVTATGSIKVTLKNSKITKSGSSSGGDSDNFYGTNSAALAKGGATLTIKNATIKTSGDGANGTFAYGGNGAQNGAKGDGSTIKISNSKITTTGNNAGGIMTTGGGTTKATNLTVKTSGRSSAAIRSDRGGGTVVVNKGTYTTSGVGSPAIYSTSDTTVKNATLESKASEGVVIEGKNSVTLKNTDLTCDNTKLNGQAKTYQAVMLYQSMSGDSAEGKAEFKATGGSITNKNGSVFYVTNTTASIDLTDVDITNKDSDNNLLTVAAGAWGNSGSNGGTVTLNASKQKLDGNITVDDISSLTMKLSKKSTFKGSVNSSGSTKGTVKVTVNKGSTWKLTADSYVTSLSGNGTIDTNGHTLYVNGVAYKG